MSTFVAAIRTGSFVHAKARHRRFWLALAAGTLVFGSAMTYAHQHYLLGFSPEAEQSVGAFWSLVTIAPHKIQVGGYAAFRTDARTKLYPPGTRFVKLIVGGPGDLVIVGVDETTVNGRRVAGPLDSAARLKVEPSAFERTFILGAGDYFVVGTRPHSYDSRYWGVVHADQFIGPARLL